MSICMTYVLTSWHHINFPTTDVVWSYDIIYPQSNNYNQSHMFVWVCELAVSLSIGSTSNNRPAWQKNLQAEGLNYDSEMHGFGNKFIP